MRFGKILTMATVPMMILACSEDYKPPVSSDTGNETPAELPGDSILPNIPDSLLKPITRDYSSIWQNGDGTEANPYQISNEQELRSIAFYVNDSSMTFKGKFFKQTADIALTQAWNPIGVYGDNEFGLGNRPFSGTFDGSSKTISGMTITDTTSYSGLFGLVRGAHVKNVIIKGAKMDVGSYAGVLAGMMDSTVVENCTVDEAQIKGADRVAGLVGEATHLTLNNVLISGSISGTASVGGVVGRLQNGTLSSVTNKAAVSGKSTIGGIVGASASVGNETTITTAFNYGDVTGSKDVGGVAATISSTKLEHSGNYGAVTASENTMGVVGGAVAVASSKASVNEVFNMGKVSATKVMAAGGVIGSMKAIVVTNVFNQGEISGDASTFKGGIVGIADGVDAKLESGYNMGAVPNDNNAGSVAGKVSSTVAVSNIYYDKTVAGACLIVASQMNMELPTGFATEDMKASTFIATLNGSGSVWKAGSATFDGYPVFTWLE